MRGGLVRRHAGSGEVRIGVTVEERADLKMFGARSAGQKRSGDRGMKLLGEVAGGRLER